MGLVLKIALGQGKNNFGLWFGEVFGIISAKVVLSQGRRDKKEKR